MNVDFDEVHFERGGKGLGNMLRAIGEDEEDERNMQPWPKCSRKKTKVARLIPTIYSSNSQMANKCKSVKTGENMHILRTGKEVRVRGYIQWQLAAMENLIMAIIANGLSE